MPPRILVVAQEPRVHQAVEAVVHDAGMACRRAFPTDDLAALLSESPADLAVVDLHPSERPALAAAEWLKSLGRDRPIPVLLLGTGNQRVRSAIDALRNHGDDYLQRPLPAGQFIQRVARYLGVDAPALTDPHALIPGASSSLPETVPPSLPPTTLPPLPATEPPGASVAARWASTIAPSGTFTSVPPSPHIIGATGAELRIRLLVPPEGSIDEGGFPAFLWTCAEQRVTCRVDLGPVPGDPERVIFVEHGAPCGFGSRIPGEGFEDFLRARGLVPSDVLVNARARGAMRPRELATALVELGALRPAEVTGLVGDWLTERIVALVDGSATAYRCIPDTVPGADRVVISEGAGALAWRGIRRKFTGERLAAIVGGMDAVLAPARRVELGQLGLREQQQKAVALFDGSRTVAHVAAQADVPAEQALQLAFLLLCTGAARVGARGTGIPPTRDGAGTPDDAIARSRLAELHRRCREQGYFALLGLPPGAGRADVEEALSILRAQVAVPVPGTGGVAAEIVEILDDCAWVLLDDARRQRYRQALNPPA